MKEDRSAASTRVEVNKNLRPLTKPSAGFWNHNALVPCLDYSSVASVESMDPTPCTVLLKIRATTKVRVCAFQYQTNRVRNIIRPRTAKM